jgi:hypothetical protein
MFLNLWRESKHAHDLGYPGAGDPLLPRDLGLVQNLAGLKEGLPLDGLAEQLHDPGRLRLYGGLRRVARPWHRAHDPIRW